MENKIILFAPIEGNLKDINTTNNLFTRYFEEEAILCFKCWRENGGWLKDIPIITYCPTKNGISEKTKKIFKELNVEYIEEYQPLTSEFKCGFWNIPLVGKIIESMDKYKDSFLIKIDLDMYLINELDKKLFKNTPVITTHTLGHNFYIENNLKDDFFNTGFLISKASDKFYDKQFKKLLEMEKAFFDKNIEEKFGLKVEYIRNNNSLEYCLLEEICVNYMIKDGEKIFKILNNCLEGEEDESDKIKIDNIYFIHEHLKN